MFPVMDECLDEGVLFWNEPTPFSRAEFPKRVNYDLSELI